jgi:hypothetical protein
MELLEGITIYIIYRSGWEGCHTVRNIKHAAKQQSVEWKAMINE